MRILWGMCRENQCVLVQSSQLAFLLALKEHVHWCLGSTVVDVRSQCTHGILSCVSGVNIHSWAPGLKTSAWPKCREKLVTWKQELVYFSWNLNVLEKQSKQGHSLLAQAYSTSSAGCPQCLTLCACSHGFVDIEKFTVWTKMTAPAPTRLVSFFVVLSHLISLQLYSFNSK